jgi:protein TonB
MGDGKLDLKVVKKTYEELPPPPSIEAPEPAAAPKGLEAKGSVGEVPLPVPDELAEADTISDAVAGAGADGFGEGTEIIVDENVEVTEGEAAPWERVNFDVAYSEAPSIIYEQRPTYPDIAKESGVEGDVVLLVYIDEGGNVRNAVVQSSPGLPALEEAAKKAAMKCKFKPAKQQGVPVGVWYSIVMQFRI